MDYLSSLEYLTEPFNLGPIINIEPRGIYGGTVEYHGKIIEGRDGFDKIHTLFKSSNPVEDLSALIQADFNFEKLRKISSISGENSVYHCCPRGSVLSSGYANHYRHPFDVYNGFDELLYSDIFVRSVKPLYWEPSGSFEGNAVGSITHGIPDIAANVDSGNFDNDGEFSRRYRNFDYDLSDNSLVIFYHYYVQHDNYASNRRYINSWSVKISLSYTTNTVSLPEDYTLACSDIVTFDCTLETRAESAYWHTPVGGNDEYNEDIDSFITNHGHNTTMETDMSSMSRYSSWTEDLTAHVTSRPYSPIVPQLLGYSHNESRYVSQSPGTFLGFCRDSDVLIRECMPLLFMAVNDAYDTHFSALESNYLETLSEYESLFGTLDIGEFSKTLLSRFSRKAGTLVSVLDILADGALLYSFGIAPTVSDAQDVAQKASKLRSRVFGGEAFGPHTVYGKYTFVVPSDYPILPEATITARCKLRVIFAEDTLLQHVVKADTIGLLPTPSRMWDLIPFSFLMDSAFPTGDSLDIVEDTMRFMAFDVKYAVNSLTIDSKFDNEFLSDHGVTVNDDYGAGYRKYVRFVSRRLPTFGATSLPVLMPSTPNWVTTGSLVWKLGT
jgi:hypothetical protein